MHKHEIRNEGDALVYLTDCTLATVETLAMRKTPPKAELSRQMSMAEHAISWIYSCGLNYKGSRIEDVKAAGGINKWVEQMQAKRENSAVFLGS